LEKLGGEEMAWQPPEGMDEFLRATELCDSNSEDINNKALELISDSETPKDTAINIFYFIRDEIPYLLDLADLKASDTLRKRWGECYNKTNLQIALLRAAGIPARYHRLAIRKEMFQGIFSNFVYRTVPEVAETRPYCECYLSGKWIACEGLYDIQLFEAMKKKGFTATKKIPNIDWDGENDLILDIPWIVKDLGTFSSYDDVFMESASQAGPKFIQRIGIYLSNRHTNRIRQH
jgi:hypothetical protein